MRNNSSIPFCQALVALVAVLVGAFLGGEALAQQMGQMKGLGFKVQLETHPAPHESQIKTSLEGEKAEPQASGRVLLTEPRLNRFTTNGLLEIQVRSPECVFDMIARTVSSTGVLQVVMGNGQFFTEGTGFLRQTNGTLILSNQVHTIIRTLPRKTSKS